MILNYLKTYAKTHIKYWYLYFLIIPLVVLGDVISLILAWIIANIFGDLVGYVIFRLSLGIITSLALVFPNYKAAKAYDSTNVKSTALFAFNQFISIVILTIIMWLADPY